MRLASSSRRPSAISWPRRSTMSDLSAEKVVAELRAVTEEDAYAVPWTTGELCRRAADFIAHQAASEKAFLAELGDVEVAGWSSAAEKLKRVLDAAEENERADKAALTAAEADKERLRAALQLWSDSIIMSD